MAMWKLSKCPRCGGNIFVDIDIDGWFEECLQCSYRHDLKSIVDYEARPHSKGEENISVNESYVLSYLSD